MTETKEHSRTQEDPIVWAIQGYGDSLGHDSVDVRVPAIKVSQAEVEDFRLDIFGARRVDGFSQLLDKKVDELGSRTLEILAKRLRGDWGSHHLAQLRGDLVDRMPWGSRASVGGRWRNGSWGWTPGKFPALTRLGESRSLARPDRNLRPVEPNREDRPAGAAGASVRGSGR